MGFRSFFEAKVEPKVYSEKELAERQSKKTNAIKNLSKNISALKSKVTRDLSSDDEKVKLTALVISIMLKTSERVGNFNSANGIRKNMDTGKMEKDGKIHIGISGLRKKNLKFSNGSVTLDYVGKSGTSHIKKITDSKIVSLLKEYSKKNEDFLFTTEDGYIVKPTNINTYLDNFDIKSKDIRTYNINRMVIDKLKNNIPKDEKERKKKFLEVIKSVADEIEHGESQTRKNYLNSVVEPNYVEKGKVLDIDQF